MSDLPERCPVCRKRAPKTGDARERLERHAQKHHPASEADGWVATDTSAWQPGDIFVMPDGKGGVQLLRFTGETGTSTTKPDIQGET